MLKCKLCGNSDKRYFGKINEKYYCRKCINFKGQLAFKEETSKDHILSLNFDLSSAQEDISISIANARLQKKNVFLYAVTGAGKTELVYRAMLDTLKEGGRVGFAIPRKDVVIDLYPRIKSAFPKTKVIKVHGGNTTVLGGEIVILTTHQLYRYPKYFDFLVFDEIDAFPYVDNDVLNNMFLNSINGNYVLMSATPREKEIKKITNEGGIYLSLTKRYHGGKLIVPNIKLSIMSIFPLLIKKLNEFVISKKPVFIFVPTIKEAEKLFKLVKMFQKNGEVVHSKNPLREKIIEDFKSAKYDYLITTSILERGVTVKNLQVIIYQADHELYDESTLIQIAGRVGRKSDAKDGEVLFLANKKTEAMVSAIEKINEANK